MSEIYLDSETIRYILQNAGRIKREGRGIYCGGTGWQNWDENGNDIKFGQTSDPDRCDGECEECEGVGYIW